MNFLEKCMCKKHKEEILGGILFGAGLVLGSVVTALCYEQKRTVNGDKILENVKKMFLAEAPIEGSWIELHPVPLSRYSSKMDVYSCSANIAFAFSKASASSILRINSKYEICSIAVMGLVMPLLQNLSQSLLIFDFNSVDNMFLFFY